MPTRLSRNRSRWLASNFLQLPAIKEEDDVIHCEDNRFDILNYFYVNSEHKYPYLERKTFNILLNDKLDKAVLRKENSVELCNENLPPFLNINCMMNTTVKQSQPIWKTNFGKRLINGKMQRNITKKEVSVQKNKELFGRLADQAKTLRNGSGDTNDVEIHKKSTQKYRKKFQKVNRRPKREESLVKKKPFDMDYSNLDKESSTDESIKSKSSTETKSDKSERVLDEKLSSSWSLSSPPPSFYGKHRKLLTQCVRSILQCPNDRSVCQVCHEEVDDLTKFVRHEKTHEAEKQLCLICNREFSKANEFVQHLLTHESVDSFSCKKCRKYFSDMDKYERHMVEFHRGSSETSRINPQTQSDAGSNMDYFPMYETTLECRKCKMKFDAKEAYVAHKRLHLHANLKAAKLLCPDTVGYL